MARYYIKKGDEKARGYIIKVIVDAFDSESDMKLRAQNLNVFGKSERFDELGFIKVTIQMPFRKLNIKINYRLHKNGRNYNVYKEDEEYKGLSLIRDIRAQVGSEVEPPGFSQELSTLKASSKLVPTKSWAPLDYLQVKNFYEGAFPNGAWFLSNDSSVIANTNVELTATPKTYENICVAQRGEE